MRLRHFLAIFAALGLTAPADALAATITPTRFDDPAGAGSCPADPCSLRQAINFVGPGGTVLLATPAPGSAETYALTQGMIDLSASAPVTIVGTGARATAISAGGASNIFFLNAAKTAAISGVTLTGGAAGSGGAISNAGNLTLSNVTVSANTATGTSAGVQPGRGGAIFNTGTLMLSASTVTANQANQATGPAATGGAIHNAGTLTAVNSTIAANKATATSGPAQGGGIYSSGSATLNLANVTLSGNSASSVGGNLVVDVGSPIVNLKNSIIAGGVSGPGTENCSLSSAPTSSYDVEDRNQCRLGGSGDQVNSDPQLGALKDNGAGTDTEALPVTSPAVDHGNPSGCSDFSATPLAADQRGAPRQSQCDVGAFEGSYPPAFGTPPTITGTPAVGRALSCSSVAPGGLPATLTYRWLREGSPIAGASAAGYTATFSDAGHALSCQVTASNADGSATAASAAVSVARPAPGRSPFAGMSLLTRLLTMLRGHVTVRVACPAAALARCTGTLAINAQILIPARRGRHRRVRSVRIAHGAFSIASGRAQSLHVAIVAAGQRLVLHGGRRGLRVTLAIAARDASGRHRNTNARVTIRAAKRPARRKKRA